MHLFINNLLLSTAHTSSWSVSVAMVMIFSNIFALVIGRFAIQNPGSGPDIKGKPDLFRQFTGAELLATMSFGHILGGGMILGLMNSGLL